MRICETSSRESIALRVASHSILYRVGRHLMDVRVCQIYEGTDEVLKLKIAAGLLGKEFEAYR